MKLRSLFLASLAAMAMVSCSNEDDQIIDNGANVEKNAVMQLGIEFPSVTRADDTNALPAEQQINDLTVVVVDADNKVANVEFYEANELVNGEVDKTKKNMTPVFEVAAGTVTVYAYVNYGKGTITGDNYSNYTESAEYSALSINNGVASVATEKPNFHMNGSTQNVVISPNVTNYAQVSISRVAAKIVEATVTKSYTPEGLTYGADLTIALTDYSLVNLNKEVNVLSDNATSIAEDKFYNFYAGTSNESYEDRFTSMPNANINAENKISYCLANQSETTTQIIYKAKATFAGEGTTEADGTFYIRNNKEGVATVYTLAKLQTEYPGVYNSCDENTTIKEWSKLGVKKYTNGVCYYKKEIETKATNTAQILRNNYYSLNVTDIKNLGTPEMDTPDPNPLTLLEVEVTIVPWTFNQNDIVLG